MNFPFFISKRYLRIGKKNNFIQIIGIISFITITLTTASLIIALSVFNGLEDLTKTLINTMKPDIKIMPKKGKFFSEKELFINNLYEINEIFKIVKVIEENVLLSHEGSKIISKIKGVSDNFLKNNRLQKNIIYGNFILKDNKTPMAIIGRGIQYSLRYNIYDNYSFIKVLHPKKIPTGLIGRANMFKQKNINVSSVFSLEKEADYKYIIVPIDFVRSLLNKKNIVSSLDIYIKPNISIQKTLKKIRIKLPNLYKALDIDEQTKGFISAMKLEKRALTIICLIIMLAALINIYFVLSMLVITKKKDIAIFFTLGATKGQIQKIFMLEGVLISTLGIFLGLILSLVLIFIQKKIGIISLGVQSSIIKYYPVKIKFFDILYSMSSVFIASLIASYKPSKEASNLYISRDILEQL
ncbi:MAG: ABC transporter permease [Bacteroidetes bacterium]|nr:ABC transporter permease [Bacteroidota bacterium]